MNDFLAFRRMITPVLIQVIFWVGVALCAIGALGLMITAGAGGGASAVLGGLFLLILGPLAIRVYCELLILFFRMNETLTEIKNNTAPRP